MASEIRPGHQPRALEDRTACSSCSTFPLTFPSAWNSLVPPLSCSHLSSTGCSEVIYLIGRPSSITCLYELPFPSLLIVLPCFVFLLSTQPFLAHTPDVFICFCTSPHPPQCPQWSETFLDRVVLCWVTAGAAGVPRPVRIMWVTHTVSSPASGLLNTAINDRAKESALCPLEGGRCVQWSVPGPPCRRSAQCRQQLVSSCCEQHVQRPVGRGGSGVSTPQHLCPRA